MATSTPGPWKVRKDYGRHWISARKIQIADVTDITVGRGMVDTDVSTTMANALLIASAPDLLAACKLAVRVLVPSAAITHAELLTALRAALFKAEPAA